MDWLLVSLPSLLTFQETVHNRIYPPFFCTRSIKQKKQYGRQLLSNETRRLFVCTRGIW